MEQPAQFAYAYNLLKRLNRLSVNGVPLAKLCIFDRYNIWMCHQTGLLYNDLLPFTRGVLSDEHIGWLRKIAAALKSVLVISFALFYSIGSVLWLLVRRPPVLLYTIDKISLPDERCDHRLEFLYKFLYRGGIPFFEIVHTTFERAFLTNAFSRRRPVLYLEVTDTLHALFRLLGLDAWKLQNRALEGLEAFSDEERSVVEPAVQRRLNAVSLSVFRVRLLRRLLKWSGVKVLLTIDDPRHYCELLLACRMTGIPTYAFQHGHFTKYHVGWLSDSFFSGEIIQPDMLFVWSDYWKRELLRLGTYFKPGTIAVGGLIRSPALSVSNTTAHRNNSVSTVTVLIPYETDAPVREVRAYVDALFACENVRVVFKLRPDISRREQLERYGFESVQNDRMEAVTDIATILPGVNVIAGTYSTLLYEMILLEKPVVLLETSSDFGEGIVINGLAKSVSLHDDVCATVRCIARTSPQELQVFRRRLEGEKPILVDDTLASLMRRHNVHVQL